MPNRDDFAADRYRLISALLTLHEEAPSLADAMTSRRSQRPPRAVDAALEEIEAGAGSRYDPRVAAVCLALFRDKGCTL